jgi:antitoxin FitA
MDSVISLLSMSDSLLIRNLPESLKPALRRRAAAHGRSVEAEARVILEEAVATDEDFVSWWLDEMASVPPGEPLEVPDRSGRSREPVSFE